MLKPQPNGPSGLFIAQWIVVDVLTTVIIGPVSPWLGFNLLVFLPRAERADPWLTLSGFFGVVICCAVIGIAEAMALRWCYPDAGRAWQWKTAGAFAGATALAAVGAYLLLIAGYIFLPLYCVGLLIWALGFAVPVIVGTRLWRALELGNRSDPDEPSTRPSAASPSDI